MAVVFYKIKGKIMNKKYIAGLILMLLALPCYGAKLKYPELSTYWGGGDVNYCGGHDMKDACIGESDKKGCVTGKIRAARNYDDEFSVLMMMSSPHMLRGII
jgi:hypothetical protein